LNIFEQLVFYDRDKIKKEKEKEIAVVGSFIVDHSGSYLRLPIT
jgi:hypothetical protein